MTRLASAFLLGAALVLAGPVRAAPASDAPADADRAAWRYRRAVTLNPEKESAGRRPTFAALPLPPDLLSRGQPDQRDLRLLDGDGKEVPFLIEQLAGADRTESWEGTLIETRSELGPRTTWVVDLGEPRTFDVIQFSVSDSDFARQVRVEAGDAPGGAFRLLRDGANIFDQKWRVRVRRTQIDLPATETARYLRIATADGKWRPLHLVGVTAERRRLLPEERWNRELSATHIPTRTGPSQYRIEQAEGLPIDAVEVLSDEPAFARPVRIFEETAASGRSQRAQLGSDEIYRLRLKETEADDEHLLVPVQRPRGGRLVLEIDDGDSPPLHDLHVRVSGIGARMLFSFRPFRPTPAASSPSDPAFVLYYGNPATRAPAYDLEGLRGRLAGRPGHALAALGPEAENPRYHPAPPLRFAASVGAPLQSERFRLRRALSFSAGEDLYGLTLQPEDLAALRPDLGDLRIADGADRQVPYVLDPEAAERQVPLTVEPDAGQRPPRTSRYHLTFRTPSLPQASLPWRALDLDFREPFFRRRARLLAAPPDNQPEGNGEVLYAGDLAREEGGPPVRLPLDGQRRHDLILEIEEGDNLPLTLQSSHGWLLLPRLAFKVVPDRPEYRLLLGSEEAEAPRYDIEGLRRTVLDYAAVPVSPGPLLPNPAYRRLAGDYFRSAPPTAILWGALLASVAVLLWLTARLLRKPPA